MTFAAARSLLARLEAQVRDSGIGWAAAAESVGVTERTLRNWRRWLATGGRRGSKPTGAAAEALRRFVAP